MSKYDHNKNDELKAKIYERLNRNPVDEKGDIISLYTLVNTLKDELSDFNKVLITEKEKYVKNKNLFRDLLNKKVYVEYVIPGVTEDGIAYIKLFLMDLNHETIGELNLFDNYNSPELIVLDINRCSFQQLKKILSKNEKEFKKYLYYLNIFKQDNPGFNFTFDSNNPNEYVKYEYSDDFMTCNVDLLNIDNTRITLKNIDDIDLATTRDKYNGILYDYIDFYNDEIMRKTEVNIEDLNPFIQSIIKRKLNLNNNNTLKLDDNKN